jgi:hypothetical protein
MALRIASVGAGDEQIWLGVVLDLGHNVIKREECGGRWCAVVVPDVNVSSCPLFFLIHLTRYESPLDQYQTNVPYQPLVQNP